MRRKYSEPAPGQNGPRASRTALLAALLSAACSLALPSCARKAGPAEAGQPPKPAAAQAAAAPPVPPPAQAGNAQQGAPPPGAPAAAPTPPPPGQAAVPPPLPAQPLAKQAGPAKPTGGPAPRTRVARPALAASIRAFGLGSPQVARMPEDFSLGPLQSLRVAEEPAAGPLTVAEAFMKCLKAGKLDAAILAPHSREALALLLAPEAPAPEGAGALPYRLGRIAMAGDSASLRVRLASGPGRERLEGSLALGRFDGKWYVEALSLDPPPSESAAEGKEGAAARPVFDPFRRDPQ